MIADAQRAYDEHRRRRHGHDRSSSRRRGAARGQEDVAPSTFGDAAIYTGPWFPIAVCVVTIVVSATWIKETKDHKLDESAATR